VCVVPTRWLAMDRNEAHALGGWVAGWRVASEPCSKLDSAVVAVLGVPCRWMARLDVPLRRIYFSPALSPSQSEERNQIRMAVAGTDLIWVWNKRSDLALHKNVRRQRRRRRRRDEE